MNGTSQRSTMQKGIVFDTVTKMRCHPTADMVYEKIHSEYPTISKATVYRILKQLAAAGEILKLPVPDGADCYDFNISPHYHIKCTDCGAVGDIFLKADPQLEAADTCGYKVTGCTVIFEGKCGTCRGDL